MMVGLSMTVVVLVCMFSIDFVTPLLFTHLSSPIHPRRVVVPFFLLHLKLYSGMDATMTNRKLRELTFPMPPGDKHIIHIVEPKVEQTEVQFA